MWTINRTKSMVLTILIYILCINQSFSFENTSVSKCLNKQSINVDTKHPGFCTIFSISKGSSVFFGNNEDWKDPNIFLWTKQPTDSTYGVIYLGYQDLFPQGGINEKGLAFDANSLPGIKLKEHRELLKPYQAIVNTYIMQKCATVEEAIRMAKSYDWSQSFGGVLRGQFMLADSTGDAVVISADQNGEIAFTRKPNGDGYFVSTNFNRAYPENKFGSGQCERYSTATKMLESAFEQEKISVEILTDVLNEVHEEGRNLNTLYSNIFDLKKGKIYLYYWHQFDEVFEINVANWISLKTEPTPIENLFKKETVDKANTEFKRYYYLKAIIIIILSLGIITLLSIMYLRKKKLRNKAGV
jgi:predicted choloylglycine hydrolase